MFTSVYFLFFTSSYDHLARCKTFQVRLTLLVIILFSKKLLNSCFIYCAHSYIEKGGGFRGTPLCLQTTFNQHHNGVSSLRCCTNTTVFVVIVSRAISSLNECRLYAGIDSLHGTLINSFQ